ncbi:MerR family transcriptional regulator [Sphingorhabdus lacus]|uniref:MerR family transcriptional regulator n=1 Tax=Sphingorhabdus lacus TaxID=392610 RepID=A0A6I6LIG5_9SPHN|nr:MerR family transcriptional regulator [Sphingorhabdus lacus]
MILTVSSVAATDSRGILVETHGGILRAQLARKTGCNLETIRYYEKVGLLPEPPRSSNGYRVYSPELVERLQFVLRARELGFLLEEIKALLGLDAVQPNACNDAHGIAKANLAAVRSKISDLQKMEAILASAVADCESRDFGGCPILNALSGSSLNAQRTKQ